MSASVARLQSNHAQRPQSELALSSDLEPDTASSAVGGYRFVVTSYDGFEEEILRMRNATRADQKSRRYLDWRYGEHADVSAPQVLWLRCTDGQAAAMASLIFRRYWCNGAPITLAVLGDICVDQRFRGQGVGRELLRHLSRQLEDTSNSIAGFVIPTEAAQKTLSALGWRTVGQLVPHVFALDPSHNLATRLRNRTIARSLAWLCKRAFAALMRSHLKAGYALRIDREPGASFDALWSGFPKQGMVLRDRSRATLAWRYARHPDHPSSFAELFLDERCVGYLIFEITPDRTTCLVHDVIVQEHAHLGCLLALLIAHCEAIVGLQSVRVLLAESHPYGSLLWRFGFLKRASERVFMIYGADSEALAKGARWCMTSGDKDI